MKRILWVNPSFLDYRIPLYQELFLNTEGSFFLIYSKFRIPERCESKIHTTLGNHAISVKKDRIIAIGKASGFSNSGIRIPLTSGLYSAIKLNHPDTVIAEGFFKFTPKALLYCIIHRVSLWIFYERTAHTEQNCPWYRLLYRKSVARFASGFLVNGTLTRDYLQSWGIPKNKIYTNCMCADSSGLIRSLDSFSKESIQSLKTELRLKNGITFLFCGQMIPRKGCKYLLAEWLLHIQQQPEDNLILVGDGPDLCEFKKKYETTQSIHFIGNVDYDKIYQYYAISDVFIIPTLEDNWSLVVQEAMACGLPIATSIYNGCYPEFATQGNGMTFDPLKKGDIQRVLADFHKVDLSVMGKKSKDIESKYTPAIVAQRIIDAITTKAT